MEAELIERFFHKQCTAKEAKEVALYLKANPSVLEKYAGIYEWNAVDKAAMPDEFWNEIWQNIQKKNKAKIFSLRLKRTAAAACLILIAGAGYYYFAPGKKINQPLVYVNAVQKAQHKLISNTTKKIMGIVLEDSSVIKLSPNSSLEYDVPFASNKRDVFLEGEAKFYVAKNKEKPFTVHTGVLTTTALGTIFSVKETANKNITVKLLEGKVVIHSNTDKFNAWDKDVYLVAGEEMKFDMQNNLVAVDKTGTTNHKKPITDLSLETVKTFTEEQLNFNNTALPEVMGKLSACFNTIIKYDSSMIDTINFTGTISKTDSLPLILKAIGQMNDLEIIPNNNEFIISKHQ